MKRGKGVNDSKAVYYRYKTPFSNYFAAVGLSSTNKQVLTCSQACREVPH